MSDPFYAEIRIFAANFAPRGWAFCNGQLLPLAQNTALFSLVGTTYGGDGRSTFALPNLQNRVPMHPGQGPGLNYYDLGEAGGLETVTLTESELPAHNHALMGVSAAASDHGPAGDGGTGEGEPGTRSPAKPDWTNPYGGSTSNMVNMSNKALSPSGGSQPHNNIQPYLALNFIIALNGEFPRRSW